MVCACLVPSHACPTGGARADWLQLTCSSAGTAVQQCTHTHTHSLSSFPPTPAEGTQGQVSRYKQLLPSVQGRSKGEGPYVCAKRGTLPVSWKGQWHATAMHTLTHTVTTCTQHTHTQLTTHIYLHAPWPAKLYLYQTKLILSIDVHIYTYIILNYTVTLINSRTPTYTHTYTTPTHTYTCSMADRCT